MKIVKLANELQIEQRSPTEWDAKNSCYEFVIRLEEDEFAIDAFNILEPDINKAYLDTSIGEAETLEDALQMCRDFNGSFTPPLESLTFPPGFGQ